LARRKRVFFKSENGHRDFAGIWVRSIGTFFAIRQLNDQSRLTVNVAAVQIHNVRRLRNLLGSETDIYGGYKSAWRRTRNCAAAGAFDG
jgi:hypothetical protein